jgi:hypothetical protein
MAASLDAELELKSLKLMLRLRQFSSGVEQAERLRGRLREALLGAKDDDDASLTVEALLRRFQKRLEELDGTAEDRRAKKRQRLEEASKFVDAEAGSGDETDVGEEEEDLLG